MASMIMCPICGKMFPVEESEFLENGNVACAECVAREEEKNNDKAESQK